MTEFQVKGFIENNENIRCAESGEQCYVVWDNLLDLSLGKEGDEAYLTVSFYECGLEFHIRVKDIKSIEISEDKVEVYWGELEKMLGMIIQGNYWSIYRRDCERLKRLCVEDNAR